MSNVSPVSDNRKHPRHRVLKVGKIVSMNFDGAVDVTIRDMSATGARIRTRANINFPETLGLVVLSERRLYPVVARWRKGEWVGIEFVGQPQPTTLRRLWGAWNDSQGVTDRNLRVPPYPDKTRARRLQAMRPAP